MKMICAKTRMDTTLCGCNPCEATVSAVDDAPPPKYSVVRMSDVEEKPTEWVIEGILPASDVVVLIGEEGIGKGLWWIEQTRAITSLGDAVVLIVAEDDPARALKPRMRAADIDTRLVSIIVADAETLTGHPYLPTDTAEVEQVLRDTEAKLLIIDPWVSVVPGHLQLKDSQQARAALDPLTVLARRTGCCILAVAHTNRTNGSTRDRVGLTAVLRHAARVLLLMLEDPDEEAEILVGVDKANGVARLPATRWRKSGDADAWHITLVDGDSGASIREWDESFRARSDARSSSRWAEVVHAARGNSGLVTRADIHGIYGPDHERAADKAISRWVTNGRLIRHDKGVFEVLTAAGGAQGTPP
jgi:hypothetical protein